MTVTMVLTWTFLGLLTGWLATFAASEGGRGRSWDLALGVAGSSVACLAAWNLSAAGSMGAFAMAVVALCGAVIVVIAQRTVWSAPMAVGRPVRVVVKSRR